MLGEITGPSSLDQIVPWIISAMALVIAALWVAYNKEKSRYETKSENSYTASVSGYENRIKSLETKYENYRTATDAKIVSLQDSEADCERRHAKLDGEVRFLRSQIKRLQDSGILPRKPKSEPNIDAVRDDDDHHNSSIHK